MKELLTNLAVSIDASDSKIPDLKAEAVVTGLLNTVYWATGIMAVVMLIIGGIFYITSDGNAQKITRAKDIIMYAIIGLVVVLAAFVITNFVIGWFA